MNIFYINILLYEMEPKINKYCAEQYVAIISADNM